MKRFTWLMAAVPALVLLATGCMDPRITTTGRSAIEPGLLSQVLNRFAGSGANILTFNQGIPSNGCAVVTVNAETSDMASSLQELLEEIGGVKGVLRGEILAG